MKKIFVFIAASLLMWSCSAGVNTLKRLKPSSRARSQ